jgi:hypothetical protein
VLTRFVVEDVERLSVHADVPDIEVSRGEPSLVACANDWVIVDLGGLSRGEGHVTLETPPSPGSGAERLEHAPGRYRRFDADSCASGATSLMPPDQPATETRCYVGDLTDD